MSFDKEVDEVINYLNNLKKINRDGATDLRFVVNSIPMVEKINRLVFSIYKSQSFEQKKINNIVSIVKVDMSKYKINQEGVCLEDNIDEYGFNFQKKYPFRIININSEMNRLLIEYCKFMGPNHFNHNENQHYYGPNIYPIKLQNIIKIDKRVYVNPDFYNCNGEFQRHCIEYDNIKRKWIIVYPSKLPKNVDPSLNISEYENYDFKFNDIK